MSQNEWASKDFYQVLGVAKNADATTIKKAYRKLARENHPDSKPGDKAAEERFKGIAEAYDVLGDSEKRQEYDQFRAMVASGAMPGGMPGGFGGFGPGGGFSTQSGGGFDISDLLGGFFTGGAGAPGAGGRGGRARRPIRGADLEATATIGFDESLAGTTISLRLSADAECDACHGTGGKPGTSPRVCPTCDGTGSVAATSGGFSMAETCPHCRGRQYLYDDPCPQCFGAGRTRTTRTIQARIPAGVKDGQRIRLAGKGAAGDHGGPAGDLLVTVKVGAHPLFGRRGNDLTLTLPVRFDEAVLGAQVSVPTPQGGPVTLRIPAGTPNGRVLWVRGRGVPGKGGGSEGAGDLLVTVEVDVPASLDDAAKQAVEAYRVAMADHDPRAALRERS